MKTEIPIDVGKDEILLICYPRQMSNDERMQIKEALRAATSAGARVLFMDGDPTVYKVKKDMFYGG